MCVCSQIYPEFIKETHFSVSNGVSFGVSIFARQPSKPLILNDNMVNLDSSRPHQLIIFWHIRIETGIRLPYISRCSASAFGFDGEKAYRFFLMPDKLLEYAVEFSIN